MPVKERRDTAKKNEIQREGVCAFHAGKPDSECPYKPGEGPANSNQKRIWWMTGYYAAQSVRNVRGVTLEEMLAEVEK